MRTTVVAAWFVSAACAACGDTPRDQFELAVAPILERHCLSTACHGVAPGAEAAGEVIDRTFFFVDVDSLGRIRDLDAAYANVKRRIDTTERAEWSTLLRKPLALMTGGVPHAGGHPFDRTTPSWVTLRDWIASERGGGEGTPRAELDELEHQFADTVLPVLRDRGCMVARCHGDQQFAGLPLVAPMDPGGDWSVAEIRANREAARATLALVGDPARSRLLRKALPLDAGGIPHRGGNDTFFPHVANRAPLADPGAQAILAWASAERRALGFGAPEVRGVVFVRGPRAPRAIVELDSFRPGSDVWFYPSLAPGATPVVVTASAHPDGPADVRDPAVSHDGSRLAFAMRRAGDACHQIWEIGLDGSGLRQRTDAGCNRWPVWGPGDALYVVSTRVGNADESGTRLDTEIYRIGDDGAATRLTFTPTPELAPSFLSTGEFRGSLAFTTMRGARGAVFRFPPDHDRAHHLQPEYHPHHGQTAPAPVVWTLRELADGRDVAALLATDTVWEGGALALVERQFGPDLPAGAEPGATVAGFRHAWTVLTGASELWRDPAPLPDDRLIAARATAPADPTDPAAMPDTALVVTSIVDGFAGPTLGAVTVLWDSPGEADDQPAIVVARPDEDDPHADAWDEAATGTLRHTGVQVNEAVLRGLSPLGARPLRDDAVTVRLLTWPSWSPADAPAIDPTQIANQDPAATWWSGGAHLPLAVVGEVPLGADGTLWAEVPARMPLRVQLVDADGFAVGAASRLWIHVQGGERFPQGTQPDVYPRLCAGCHGALDGDPAHAMPPIDADAITGASITLSTFADRNPRRPLAPRSIGEPGAKGFDFGRDLAPSLERSCAVAGCHVGATPAGGLALTPTPTAYYDAAYEALQAYGAGSTGGKKYVDERGASARGSYLIEKILGRELDAPRALDFRCPPAGAPVPPLDEDVIAALIRWIDLGAVYRSPGVEASR